ncbi:MAG TPA: SDR family oxidoreductase, partial [Plasticicumulans sp.]
TRTAMAEARYAELGIDAAQAAAGVPLGRIVEPAEVAALALWLCSPAAGAITGQALTIDGGTLA